MADPTGVGYYPPDMGHYGPGYGMTIFERLHAYIGRDVTVYVGEESTPVRGMLHGVGSNYIEVHRMTNNVSEALFIPMHSITAVSAPVDCRTKECAKSGE